MELFWKQINMELNWKLKALTNKAINMGLKALI